ncbi:MAG: 30S ribosome-binding factor RbfA [Verrucomicrobiota bacterium]|jgi:ribosome-binding factor A|nr:30S ribosome-binding factor RbfA [Verrucomicrobiota bacterium]
MKADRITRVNELIRRELGLQLYRVVNRPDFNPAAVTFTHVLTSVDLRSSRVLASVLGDLPEQERMLRILKLHRVDFQKAIRDHIVLRYTPHLHFVLDHSVEQGDHVLQLLNQMEENGDVTPQEDSPEEPPP